MKIVKPTRPESMAVLVDTIMHGDVTIMINPSEITRSRVDIIFVTENLVGVLTGPSIAIGLPVSSWPLPTLPEGARALAKVVVHSCVTSIYDGNIMEL